MKISTFFVALLLTFSLVINAQSISRLVLINASTNAEIKDMPTSGETIDLDVYPLINFRAITSPEPLDGGAKVIFKLTYPDGKIYNHSEGTAVYACFGDNSGDYKDWENGFESPPSIQNGDYTLIVTPGTGAAITYSFTIKKTISTGGGSGEEVLGTALEVAEGEILITGEKKQWHNVTLNCGGPQASETGSPNPFKDYRFEVTFTKGSSTLKVPGYFAADGNAGNTHATDGKIWKVHFCPPEIGTWNYSISFVSGTEVAVNGSAGTAVSSLDGKTGTIEVVESDKTGRDFRARGRLAYKGSRYLQFMGNGEYFVKAGPDSPENFLAYNDFDNTLNKGSKRKSYTAHAYQWRDGDPTWLGTKGKSIIGAVNYLASKGINAFSFLTMNIGGDDKNVFPYISDSQVKQFDCSKLDQWEVVFDHAQKLGMYLHFKTQETENERMLDDGNTTLERALYYRELIARFGHHLALNWNLGEENGASFNEGKKPLQNDAQRIAMAKYFKDNDPYKNHIVLHTAPNDYDKIYGPLLGSKSELTGASVQTHYGNVHDITKTWVNKSATAGKQWVIANDEQGPATWGVPNDAFVSGKDSKGNTVPNKHEIRHKTLWGNLMAGGAGVEYYFGYDWNHSDLTCQDFSTRNDSWEYCKNALDFFNLYIPFWDMTSTDNLTSSGYCFSKSNMVYAVYLPNGGSANVTLGTGTYSVKWYNPRDGGALKDGATGIAGGGSKSVSAPDSNNDWVALITESNFTHDGNSGSPIDVIELPEPPVEVVIPAECGDPIVLTSFSDFPTFTNITGFKNAYKDNGNQCLAINAAQFKDEYAAAQSSFVGETGFYNITITTLTEIDGESSYRLKVGGVAIGEYQNPETATDYAPSEYTWPNVEVQNGDIIQVEFSSHTNGKIPEGDITAYSRGRWKQVRLGPVCKDCTGPYIEEEGVVVIEPENVVLHDQWRKRPSDYLTDPTMAGSSGNGWVEWNGPEKFGTTLDDSQANGISVIKFKITKEGDYTFRWRSKQYNAGQAGDQGNDTYVKFETGTPIAKQGSKGNSYTLDKFTKVWVQSKQKWSWATNFEPHHGEFVYFPSVHYTAGMHEIKIAGRSKGHSIDRMVLYHADKTWDESYFTGLAESKREGCTGGGGVTPAKVAVTDLYMSYDTVYVFDNESYSLRTTILPENASNKTINWVSEKATIATVSNGNVSALARGEVWVYAKSDDDAAINDSCLVVILKDRQRAAYSKTGFTAIYADSESTAADGDARLKEHAIDGDVSSFWHTEWKNNKPVLPHELQIDLGDPKKIDFIDYYPRQDEYGPNGAIGSYEIYVSNDNTSWGEPVIKDYLRWAKNATKADYRDMQRIFLSESAEGRYIRFVALSEAQNLPEKPLTAIAELDFWAYTADDSSVGEISEYGVNVFPNPCVHNFEIFSSVTTIERVNVYSLDGKLVKELACDSNPIRVNIENFPTGIYVLKLQDVSGNLMACKMIKRSL